MSEKVQSRGRVLAKLAATIVVAGALLAGLLFPWVGGTGLVARNSASLLDALPVELTDKTPAGNSRVLAADGSLITNFFTNNRTPVTPDQISDVMKQALVDIEDSRFYDHNGLDVQGTLRALVTNVAAGSVQEGGSTLTQQLVKQTLLQTAATPEEQRAATEQDVARKLREARLALALEETYSKDEILTRYLNIVYFGEGAYGIQAAAQKYFSVNAIDLTLPQAAMLAGLVQSPTNDDPITQPENAVNRRNQVLQRMNTLGHITDQELTDISAQPVAVVEGADPPNGCIDAALGGFFCDYLKTYLVSVLGITDETLDNGGLTIQTTLRPDLQQSGDQAVLNNTPMGDPFAGIFTAVQPGTGHVLAMSENRRYGCSDPECESVNLNVVASAGSGSTYKVFTAAAALSAGFGSTYTINAPQPYTSRVFKQNGGTRGAPYRVSNDNAGYAATYNLTTGLTASSNTFFVALEDALGSVEGPVTTAKAMGMHFDGPNQLADCGNECDDFGQYVIDNELGSFTLGPIATSPLDLANSYGTIAAQGTKCDPTPVTAITDRTGQPLKDDAGKVIDTGDHCTPNAIPAGVANTLANMMLRVVEDGTGRRAAIPGVDVAGKTGTIQGNNSATFVGITPQYAVSVMYFNPKAQQDVGGHGGGLPADIFQDAMAPILTAEPATPFPPADPAVAAGTRGTGYVPPSAPAPAETPAPTDGQPQPQPQPPANQPGNDDPFGEGFPFND
ncbi:transglycosylase domain-containing protein [Blastococcus sp. CT_GayMR16]|uniref:transglycosylase domain-containing protein n=1 Tax=Blastococcus sp. CT_GayMR16 TaxID=2559607 RepID=UPI0010734D1D|nr:transglycosylase domain-containing protein [Blastococcus sp. CT_GayMR16]TFV90494.1 penicillin-binding protein [Blastococcus sp. CT_GayMR16]